jgi:glucosamine-6-phosphate deaminase
MRVSVHADRAAAGAAAAQEAAEALRETLDRQESARVVFAAAPSQLGLLAGLREAPGVDWSRVAVFHLDEYVDLPAGSPARFSHFLHTHLWDAVRPGQVHAIEPGGDPEAECARYAGLLAAAPLDLICLGVGDNGHLAFNDPPVADFADPLPVKVVALDAASRTQQVADGCFADLGQVPRQAVTLTIPTLMAGGRLVATVPGARKKAALRAALDGPLTTACPASVLRTHPRCALFADQEAHG